MSMLIFDGVENLKELINPVLTIGTFDGIHLGHQKIIKNLIREAKSTNSDSVLLTFFPHPRMVLFPEDTNLQLIQTQEEKYNKLAEQGLQNIIVQPFSKEFAKLTALEFIEEIIVKKIRAKKIIIGYDHQFGNSREGNINFLREYSDKFGYEVIEIPAKEIDEILVKILPNQIDNDSKSFSIAGCSWKYFGCSAASTAAAMLCHASCDATALATTAGFGIPACVIACGAVQAWLIVKCEDKYCNLN